jgi:hypothetical protein
MAQERNIVHQYFKREFDETTILVKVNPIQFKGTEITILQDGKIQRRELEFDEGILEDLHADGFKAASALEFNIYLSGLR